MSNRSKQPRKTASKRATTRVHTTVGELLSVAYELTGGKAERAAELLTRGLVLNRRLRFV